MEKRISLKNPRLVNVRDEHGRVYAGGDQAWLESRFQRDTGCGSVSITNQLLYLTSRREVSKSEFLREYYNRFGGFGMPLSMIPTASRYASLGVKYLKKLGIEARAVKVCSATTRAEDAVKLITDSLRADIPVGIQRLWNKNEKTPTWHWMTITAIENPGPGTDATVTVSTWGQLRTFPFGNLWRGRTSLVVFIPKDGGTP